MPNRIVAAAILPALGLLAACGQDIPVTNENNVVPNDALSNTAFINDGEVGNDMIQVEPGMNAASTSAGEAMMSNTVGTEAARNDTMTNMAE